MARHTDLPVYKLAYDLLQLVTEITKHMPRDFKFSLGRRIQDECLSIVVLIGRANAATNKTPHTKRYWSISTWPRCCCA